MLAETHHIAHGTTSSLNALVTGKVPDGRLPHHQGPPRLDLHHERRGPLPRALAARAPARARAGQAARLLPKRHALEVTERIDRDGERRRRARRGRGARRIRALLDDGVRAIAVSLLWSFRNPVHERRMRELVARDRPGRVRRAVERGQPADPRVRAQRDHDHEHPDRARACATTSTRSERRCASAASPGRCSSCRATAAPSRPRRPRRTAISTVGSVLTGGVVGSVALGRQLGHRNIISTDVGGTTFLAGLVVDGEPVRATTTVINHHPINVPTLRVHAIGSGGGAIAWVDAGGNLRIGPRSARAVPGPACYDQGGTEPTNTDANLVLGILPERGLLGGRKPLSLELAREAIRRRIAEPLGLSVEEAAAAIYAVQNAQTGDLLRKTVVEAGHDPRDFVVYAFGGAGPGALRRATPPSSASRRSSSRSGRSPRRSPPTGSPRRTSCSPRELSDPAAAARSTRCARSGTSPQLEDQVRDGPRPPGPRVRVGRARTARSTCATRCSSSRSPSRSPADRSTTAALDGGRGRVRGRATPSCTATAPASARPASRPSPTACAAAASCRSRPSCPRVAADGPDPAPPRRRHAPGAASTSAAGFVDTPIYDYARLRAGHVLAGPAIVEVPTTTVVVPAGTHRHRRRARQPHHPPTPRLPKEPDPWPCRSPAPRGSPAAPSTPTTLAALAARDAAGPHRRPRSRSTRSTRSPTRSIRHRLWSVTDEMGEALKRMSGSPIVTDANDFDFAISRRARPGGPGRALQHDARRRRRPRHLLDAAAPREQPGHRRGRHVPVQRPVGRRRAAPERRDGLPARLPRGEAVRLDQRRSPPARPRRRRARLVLPGRAGRVLRVAADPADQGRARRPAAATTSPTSGCAAPGCRC